jgi:predicted lipoprotein with Yx(FWY)xxD motif
MGVGRAYATRGRVVGLHAMLARRSVIATLAAAAGTVVVVVAGCGGSDDPPARVEAPPPATARAAAVGTPTPDARRPGTVRRGETIRVVHSQFGRILADRRGQAVYLFDRETSGRSECYGPCAVAWPPVFTKGRPVAAHGVHRGLLGTTRRRDGRLQVTYRGRPLYLYVGDAPGRVLCHDVFEFGGRWLVMRPSGIRVA